MNNILVSSLLGMAVFSLHVTALEGPVVDVWPSASEIYLGESVLLHCRLEANSSSSWTYHWYRNKPNTTLTPSRRHFVSEGSFSITAVAREDEGSYWCTAEQVDSNVTTQVEVELKVSALLPPSLTLTPSSRQIFSGHRFSVQCPARTSSTHWKLWHFSPERKNKTQVCPQLGATVGVNFSDTCVFTADRETSGLYWCEEAAGRSHAVNITVSYENIILKIPAFSVHQGSTVVMYCEYRKDNQNETIFYKNGIAISSLDKSTNLTIEKVTQDQEGLYKCVSWDRKMESEASWLSVTLDQGSYTSKAETAADGSWKWIVPVVVVLLFMLPLSVWLVQHNRNQTFRTKSCWLFSKEDIPAVPLPATKQDVTEVQWDLSWMEMSNLLDKQFNPST